MSSRSSNPRRIAVALTLVIICDPEAETPKPCHFL